MRYSTEPRDRVFVKNYGFLSFLKNMGKNIGKNVSKNLSAKYSPKLLDHAKKSVRDAFKTTLEMTIQKTATGDLLVNKIADAVAMSYNHKIIGAMKTFPSKTEDAEFEKSRDIARERCISPEKKNN